MNKNLVLVQNGYPHSTKSGTEVDSLDITNFFKFEKDVVPSKYVNVFNPWKNDTTNTVAKKLEPFTGAVIYQSASDAELQMCINPSSWYEKEGELKYNNSFKHYSISFLLFAVRMQKGFLGSSVTIASRLAADSPLKLKFYDIGETLDDFKNINKFIKYMRGDWRVSIPAHKALSNGLVIPTLNQYNHCFLAALFSDSAYLKASGTKLLDNEPLLNISWTETAFTTEG